MIPKIVHYCWFGGNEMPDKLKKCLDSWKILEEHGFKIMRWDETNCSFNENDFVKNAYLNKKWAFVSDYYRLKALYEWGGVYLDTDVMVHKAFDDLLGDRAFICYSYDVAFSAAVMASEKNGTFVKGILDMYENGRFITQDAFFQNKDGENPYRDGKWQPNNEFISWYIIKFYDVSLNNKEQIFPDVHIYPNYLFDCGRLTGKYYSRHLSYNSWAEKGKEKKNPLKNFIHKLQEDNAVFWIIMKKIGNMRDQKKTSFYKCRKAIFSYKKQNSSGK